MSATPSGWLRLQTDSLTAQIDPQGAQLSVLRDREGRDLLWHGDPALWKGRAPILFPIVGALNGGHYTWLGIRHALPRHGFARDRRFDVVSHTAHEALLRLTNDAHTHVAYPFAFALDVRFSIERAALNIVASVQCRGEVALPASLGFHPALSWPLPYGGARGAHDIQFEHDEPAPIRRLDAQGLLTPTLHPTPVQGGRLVLRDDLFADDVIIFERFTSRSLTYGADAGPRIKVSFPDATYLGLWTKPGASFICIEPWRGVADPAGFTGTFDQKPGVFMVAPGDRQSLTMQVEILAA